MPHTCPFCAGQCHYIECCRRHHVDAITIAIVQNFTQVLRMPAVASNRGAHPLMCRVTTHCVTSLVARNAISARRITKNTFAEHAMPARPANRFAGTGTGSTSLTSPIGGD